MNNNQINFDPITGQPLQTQNNDNNSMPTNGQINNLQFGVNQTIQPTPQVNNMSNPQIIQPNIQQNEMNQLSQMQSIPTVDQSKDSFINNTQATVQKNNNNDTPKVNYVFVAILFIIIFAAILFLFPYLQKNL